MTEARRIREKLGVDQNILLSPKKPTPNMKEGTLLQCLSHNGVFSAGDCAKIIADNADPEWITGMVNAHAASDKPKGSEYRSSKHIWLERDEKNLWCFDKMLAVAMAANKLFEFDIDFFEALQLTRYDEGDHYNWHFDLGPGKMGNRKMSITVQLSSPDDYEGGDLEIQLIDAQDFSAPREIGSVSVFPSFMKHRVTPVTKGTRYSLVVWASGTERFK